MWTAMRLSPSDKIDELKASFGALLSSQIAALIISKKLFEHKKIDVLTKAAHFSDWLRPCTQIHSIHERMQKL